MNLDTKILLKARLESKDNLNIIGNKINFNLSSKSKSKKGIENNWKNLCLINQIQKVNFKWNFIQNIKDKKIMTSESPRQISLKNKVKEKSSNTK